MRLELEWRPPEDLDRADKEQMPVSVIQLADGTRMVVSRFGDDLWDFYPYIPQDNLCPASKRLSWAIALPDGRLLTDAEHLQLLQSAKDFIWASIMNPPAGRARPKLLTVLKNLRHLTPLLRWMTERGIKRFADLDGCIADYIPVAMTSVSINCRGAKPARPSPDTVARRLFVVEDLFRQRNKLADALGMHPWPLETACALAGYEQAAVNVRPKTEFIPDEILFRLANAALDYVQQRADSIIGAVERAETAAAVLAVRGRSRGRQSYARTASARRAGYEGFNVVVAEAVRLRTACYIVIDLFSGLRDSEMISIEENCIQHGMSDDASTPLLWMHGTIYKTGHRPKRWLVPSIVSHAVKVLTRLTAPQREHLRREHADLCASMARCDDAQKPGLVSRLTAVTRQQRKLFLCMTDGAHNAGPSALIGSALNKNLRMFCAELEILDTDGKPYPLHAHQFRRTYARLAAKAELGDLLYLRDHFGHFSTDMTAYYADGSNDDYQADIELLELVSQEKLVRQNEVVGRYLTTDEPLANGGHWLADWRKAVRTAKNKEALVAEYAGTITLNGTGHSWCIGNARGNGCGGLCMMQAQMCVDCTYGVIGQEHRPVWEGIRDQQLEALALDDMGPGGKARAEEILRKAEKVLHRLDGQDAP